MKELLNTTISRRDAVTTTAKLGAAVALSNAITLPFSTTVRAETSDRSLTAVIIIGSMVTLSGVLKFVQEGKSSNA
ncbi:hypothetical protein ACUOFC_20945, partial [Escherichia sp. TWPC-MK]